MAQQRVTARQTNATFQNPGSGGIGDDDDGVDFEMNDQSRQMDSCDTTIVSLLTLDVKESQIYSNLCGIPPQACIERGDSSASCFFNDKHCEGYVINGFCYQHQKFFLAEWIMEYTGEVRRPIPVSVCNISNSRTVPIFPLMCAQRNLHDRELTFLNHTCNEILQDSAQYLKAISQPINNTTISNEKTEYIKKIIQFSDNHRSHLLSQMSYLKNTSIYLYFTEDYVPKNKKVKAWFDSAKLIEKIKVVKVPLIDLNNMIDIYVILSYMPAKCINDNGSQIAYIPNVVVLNGFICYGSGYGQTKFIEPSKVMAIPPSYKIHTKDFWNDVNRYPCIRVPPLSIDAEAKHNQSPVLVVLDVKRNQTLHTQANVVVSNTKFRIPNLDDQRAIEYPCQY